MVIFHRSSHIPVPAKFTIIRIMERMRASRWKHITKVEYDNQFGLPPMIGTAVWQGSALTTQSACHAVSRSSHRLGGCASSF